MVFSDDDLGELEKTLMNDPEAGDIMEGTGGVRKIRFAFPGKGKSGSVRVCYVDFIHYESTYFLMAFSKKEKSNLTDAEKNEVKKMVKVLRQECEKNRGVRNE